MILLLAISPALLRTTNTRGLLIWWDRRELNLYHSLRYLIDDFILTSPRALILGMVELTLPVLLQMVQTVGILVGARYKKHYRLFISCAKKQ